METYLITLAEAFVSVSGGERNMFFWANARKILIGLMAWLVRKGKTFPATMTAISTHDVMNLIEQALDESDSELVKKMLSSYVGKTGEDMQSIQTEVTTSIDIFAASSSMDWALAESPRIVSPYDIACGHSIFLSIEQERISEYGAFIRLFYSQIFQYLIADRENQFTSAQLPVWVLLEEAPLYGAIPHLDSFLSTCRSRKISVYVICQSISQLEGAYGKERASTILDDCLVKVVLGVANAETAELFSKLTGQYEEEKAGTQAKGLFKLPASYSYNQERRRCMDPEEFFTLKSNDAVVLFIDGHFMQVKKIKYYEDAQLSALMRNREVTIEAEQKRKNEVTDLLDAVYEISGDGTYIFPGEAADGCLGINSIYKHYTRACAAIGVPIQKDIIRGPHAWRRNFAKRLGNSYISSHLLGNDQKVCEENYSNAIDFAEALAELEKKGLKKGLKIGLKMDQTLKKEA